MRLVISAVTILVLVAQLLLPMTALAQEADIDYEWQLKRDRDDIKIYLSKVPGSKFRAIRSVMEVESTPSELVALVMDLPNCGNWAALCKEARVERQISDTQSYVYTRNDLPFPVRDRDVIAKVVWSVDQQSGKVSMHSHATVGEFPERKGVIRIEHAQSEWHFTPTENGHVLVESYAHIDPNGATPAWITNLLMVDSPFETMQAMRDLVEAGLYADTEVSFIARPMPTVN